MTKDRRFIGKFVNGVYGILLGFGFCNVVEDIVDIYRESLDNVWLISHISMAIFIIIVVCLYWWDWSENIESVAKSTFSEFTIDILILFNLEFLFFSFVNPKALAVLFLALSIFNFIWVLNYLLEKHNRNPNSKGFLRNTGDVKYLLKKVYNILIYGTSLFLIHLINKHFINKHFDPLEFKGLKFAENNLAYIYCCAIVILFFIISRYVSFKNRPLNSLTFRAAVKEDIEAIVNIHNLNAISNQSDIETQGFLLEKINSNIVLEGINSVKDEYFVAVDKANNACGYAVLSNEIDKNILSKVEWEETFINKSIFSHRHLYIAVVAVNPDFLGRGVGQYIYNALFSKYSNYNFTTFVATKPFRNQRSLDFHTKQGFYRIGKYKNVLFCNLKNYESTLFLKTM